MTGIACFFRFRVSAARPEGTRNVIFPYFVDVARMMLCMIGVISTEELITPIGACKASENSFTDEDDARDSL